MSTKLRFRFEYEWQGGHHAGCVNYSKGAWIVRFIDGTRKQFHEKFYGFEEAKRLAEEWRVNTSLEKGLTKNRYRIIEDDLEGRYIEMQLQKDYIAKFDELALPLATKCIWTAKQEKFKKVAYMEHSGKKKKGIPPQRFHRLLCPLFKIVDHINRDGLDNRLKNLRNGEGSINACNQSIRKDNSSGKTGVHFSKYDNCWIVQYPFNGKRCKKSFSVSKYGDEGAQEKAIEFRKTIDYKYNIMNGYNPN